MDCLNLQCNIKKEEEISDETEFCLTLYNWNIHLYWLSPYVKLLVQIKIEHEKFKSGFFKFIVAYEKEEESNDVSDFGLSLFNW